MKELYNITNFHYLCSRNDKNVRNEETGNYTEDPRGAVRRKGGEKLRRLLLRDMPPAVTLPPLATADLYTERPSHCRLRQPQQPKDADGQVSPVP